MPSRVPPEFPSEISSKALSEVSLRISLNSSLSILSGVPPRVSWRILESFSEILSQVSQVYRLIFSGVPAETASNHSRGSEIKKKISKFHQERL